jgi:hypothetical protein
MQLLQAQLAYLGGKKDFLFFIAGSKRETAKNSSH